MPISRSNTSNRLRGGRSKEYYSTYEALLLRGAHTRVFTLDNSTPRHAKLRSLAATTNFSTNDVQIAAGESNAETNGFHLTLLQPPFDLLPAPGQVFSFTNVYLDLTITLDRSSNARDFQIYRVLRNWVISEATWNVWSTGNNWTTAGCLSDGNDFDGTNLVSTLNMTATETVGTVKRFSLDTTILYNMFTGAVSNYGLVIRVDKNVGSSNDLWVWGSEYVAGSEPVWTFETVEAS